MRAEEPQPPGDDSGEREKRSGGQEATEPTASPHAKAHPLGLSQRARDYLREVLADTAPADEVRARRRDNNLSSALPPNGCGEIIRRCYRERTMAGEYDVPAFLLAQSDSRKRTDDD
ncbi:hypothetical protein [Caballeronia grimmiae]|uniref:hypothetical protein n=1 Tax=Caballeronia grimmiae TaxID=1071679 RepID=UPI0038B84165